MCGGAGGGEMCGGGVEETCGGREGWWRSRIYRERGARMENRGLYMGRTRGVSREHCPEDPPRPLWRGGLTIALKTSSTSPLERWAASKAATLLSSAASDVGGAEGPGGVVGAGRSPGGPGGPGGHASSRVAILAVRWSLSWISGK